MKCASCGTDCPDGLDRCSGCGADLATPILDERKLVTVLFADIAGFTDLAESTDPEIVAELLNELLERLVPCVARYGGTVDKFMGDAIMAVFGAPAAHENDPERAIRCALDMHAAVAAFSAARGTRLLLHIGINTGLVLAGSVGTSGRHDYSVIGDAVNVASRLEDLSAPGETLIGPETFRFAGHLFQTESAGTAQIRGRTEELEVRRVSGLRPQGRVGRSSATISPLVGREAELQAFERLFERLDQGHGSIAFVFGEAGLGKSRLLAELREWAGARRFAWLEGRTLSFGDSLPFWPLKEIMESDNAIESGDSVEVQRAKLQKRAGELGQRQVGGLNPLEILLGLSRQETSGGECGPRDEEAFGRELLQALLEYFEKVASNRPTILVFEDVQWLDPSSEAVIGHLLPLVDRVPLLVCLAGRPDDGSAGLRILDHLKETKGDQCTEIRLSPLSGEQTRKMVHQLLGFVELPRGLDRAIEAKTGGNPLFVQEVVRSLEETGSLRDSDAIMRGMNASGLGIPDTLQGVLSARVDRLSPHLKYDLRVASVIGRDFPLDMLAAVGSRPTTGVATSVTQLEALGLVARRGTGAEPYYSFNHALIQDAAYDSLPVKDRKRFHARLANVTEASFPERLDEFAGVLAYHYSRAEDWGKAQEFLMRAGGRCFQLAAGEEGRRQYQGAMDVLLKAFDAGWQTPGTEDPVEWFVERAEAIRLLRSLGSLADAVRAFHVKVEGQYGPEDRRTLAAALLLGAALNQAGQCEEATVVLERAVAAYDRGGRGDQRLLQDLLGTLGVTLFMQERLGEAEKVLRRGLALARADPKREPRRFGSLFASLSAVLADLGRATESSSIIEEALQYDEIVNGTHYCELLINKATTDLNGGRWAEAEDTARRAVTAAGHLFTLGCADSVLGEVLLTEGNYPEAERYLGEAAGIFENVGTPREIAFTLFDLAETQLRAGRREEARENAVRARAITEASFGEQHSFMAWTQWTLAGIAMDADQLDEAERLLLSSAKIARMKLPAGETLHAEIAFRHAQLMRRLGRQEEAEERFRAAQEVFRQLGVEPHPRLEEMTTEWVKAE